MKREIPGLPTKSTKLVEHLDQLYPDECIREGESYEAAIRRAGQRDVIRYLHRLMASEDHDAQTIEDYLNLA